MQSLRYYHRLVTLVIVVFLLFLGVTGTMIQLIDMKSIYTHAPATDANVRAMRESFDGPADFVVRQSGDYLAQALPARIDYPAALARVMGSARRTLGDAPLKYVEFRMDGARPVGQVGVGEGHARFDAATGALVERTAADQLEDQSPASPRNFFKRLHRMTTFGNWALAINIIVSVGLVVLIVTGVWIYVKLYGIRRKIRKPSPFWSGGGTWRSLHRAISILSIAFLVVVSASGAWLAVESVGLALFMARHGPPPGPPHGTPGSPPPMRHTPDASSPLRDGALPAMLATSLTAERRDAPADPIKVLRLRYYAGYPQGVFVTGGDRSRQLVYNGVTGAPMSETEPGYPVVPFPFGWQAHQIAKSIHRGDYIGLSGRWMDLLAGLSLIYLTVSGIEMYWQMWRKRQRAGRKRLIWN